METEQSVFCDDEGVGERSAPSRTKYATAPIWGPRASPAQRVTWRKEKQGSGRSFCRKAKTKSSGLCDDARTAPATVYKCALVTKGLAARPRISAVWQPVPLPPKGGKGQ